MENTKHLNGYIEEKDDTFYPTCRFCGKQTLPDAPYLFLISSRFLSRFVNSSLSILSRISFEFCLSFRKFLAEIPKS